MERPLWYSGGSRMNGGGGQPEISDYRSPSPKGEDSIISCWEENHLYEA